MCCSSASFAPILHVSAAQGFEALEALFKKGAPAVDELVEVARALRRLPLVDPFLPTVRLSAPTTWASVAAASVDGTPPGSRANCRIQPPIGRRTPEIARILSCFRLGAESTAWRLLPWQVALVGAPNVGKSSLVALLSSGAPEVCDYPFTTRSIKMGHFFVSGRRHQVPDHPDCD